MFLLFIFHIKIKVLLRFNTRQNGHKIKRTLRNIQNSDHGMAMDQKRFLHFR